MFLCLDRLMKSVGIAAARHDTPCKFIDDQNLFILYHIIFITEHQIIRPQGQDNIVLDLQIFRVSQIFNVEKFFHFPDAFLCQVHYLILFINNEVSRLLDLLAHNGV